MGGVRVGEVAGERLLPGRGQETGLSGVKAHHQCLRQFSVGLLQCDLFIHHIFANEAPATYSERMCPFRLSTSSTITYIRYNFQASLVAYS